MPQNYDADPMPPGNAPRIGGTRFDFSAASIGRYEVAAANAYSILNKGARRVLKFAELAAVTVAGNFLPGVSMVYNLAKNGAAAHSTQQHLDRLGSYGFMEGTLQKCICRRCNGVFSYIYAQKEKKLDRRMMKMAPGLGLIESIRAGVHGLTKANRGAARSTNACILWIAAKDGCPTAKSLIDELCSSDFDEESGMMALIEIMNSYLGILTLAEKLKST